MPSNSEGLLTRRKFFKLLGLGAVGYGVNEVAELHQDGGWIKTKWGSFLQVPEVHQVLRQPYLTESEQLPDPESYDILFREATIYAYTKFNTGERTIREPSETIEIFNESFPSILEQLKTHHKILALGDIAVTSPENDEEFFKQELMILAPKLVRYLMGGVLYFSANGIESDDDSEIPSNRRAFLKKVMYAVSAAGLSPLLLQPTAAIATLLRRRSSNSLTSSLEAVIHRVNGLSQNLNPGDWSVFLRNLIWVIKTSHYSSERSNVTQREMRTVMNAGVNHELRDLLDLGPEMCLNLLSFYPKSHLEHLVKMNGGHQIFSSLFLIDPVKQEQVQFIDKKLQKLLEEKLDLT